LDVDTNAGRVQIGGCVDRSNIKRQVASEFEESDIERVWREIGSDVATVVHRSGFRWQVDCSERCSCNDIRLKPNWLIIVDEQQNPLLNVRYRRLRAAGKGRMEIMDVDLRGIRSRANGSTGCAGVLNPANKLHAVNERHDSLPPWISDRTQ